MRVETMQNEKNNAISVLHKPAVTLISRGNAASLFSGGARVRVTPISVGATPAVVSSKPRPIRPAHLPVPPTSGTLWVSGQNAVGTLVFRPRTELIPTPTADDGPERTPDRLGESHGTDEQREVLLRQLRLTHIPVGAAREEAAQRVLIRPHHRRGVPARGVCQQRFQQCHRLCITRTRTGSIWGTIGHPEAYTKVPTLG